MQGSVALLGGQFNPAILGDSSTPVVFECPEFGSLRVMERDGEPWFVAKDVCAALEIVNHRDAIADLDDDEKNGVGITDSIGRPQSINIISEPGLYSLIMRSRKPEAKAFKRWITHEVLPSIRKRGVYATGDVIDAIIANPDMGIKLLTELKAERESRAQAEQAAQIEHERAEYYRATKAEIGSRREATAMATASAATRKASTLENELGRGKDYKQVKAIPWLLDEFEESRAMYQQVGKKLKSMSDRMGYATNMIPCPEYPDGVKAYHIDVIEAFRVALMTDLNMLSKYRKRKH